MKRLVPAVLAASLLIAATGEAGSDDSARALRGRVPGKPVSCITLQRFTDHQRIFDDHSVLYDGYGSTVYLNRVPDCPQLTARRGIVSVTPSDELCSGDIVQVVDFPTHFNYGSCALGDFVPYARAKKAG